MLILANPSTEVLVNLRQEMLQPYHIIKLPLKPHHITLHRT
jgi:hypothetical protein